MTTILNQPQRKLLARTLQARQRALQDRLRTQNQGASRVDHAREVLTQDGDDAPQRASDREVDQMLSDHEIQELAAVGQALQRIDNENFGCCVGCGEAIPFDRLQVEPQALRCVACESIHERNT
jgi:DnaK suppressor protein